MVNNMQKIAIEVAYVSVAQKSYLLKLHVRSGCTVLQAIEQSGILQFCPEINLTQQKVGVFSQSRELNDVVHADDRIEIYRPLLIDPKDARRAKAKKKK